MWAPSLVNNFVFFPEALASGSKELDSPELKDLGLKDLSVIFVRRFEASLELLLWNVWETLMAKVDEAVVLDPSSSSSKEQIMVKYPTPSDLVLPFTGHVTSQSSDPKAIHIGTIFGVKFFLTPSPNVCVPAWSVKTVTRLDQAFFSYHENTIKVLLVLGKDPRKHLQREVVFGDLDLFIICDVKAQEQEANTMRLTQQKDKDKDGKMPAPKSEIYISEEDTRHALLICAGNPVLLIHEGTNLVISQVSSSSSATPTQSYQNIPHTLASQDAASCRASHSTATFDVRVPFLQPVSDLNDKLNKESGVISGPVCCLLQLFYHQWFGMLILRWFCPLLVFQD